MCIEDEGKEGERRYGSVLHECVHTHTEFTGLGINTLTGANIWCAFGALSKPAFEANTSPLKASNHLVAWKPLTGRDS